MEYSENQLIEQFNDDFKKVVFPVTVFVVIEIIIGFVGNILVLYVFYFRYRPCNFRIFVLCLVLTDLISTMTTMPGEVLTQLKWYTYPDRQICKIKSIFNIFTLSAEMFCLMTIAVDRYRKICKPFEWQISQRMTRFLCAAIYIISAILSIPVYFLWGTRRLSKTYRNTTITVTICEKDELYARTPHPFQYILTVYVVYAIFLTSIIMLYMYILIVRKLAIHSKSIFKRVIQLKLRPSIRTGDHFKFQGPPSINEPKTEELPAVCETEDSSGQNTETSSTASKTKTTSINGTRSLDAAEKPISIVSNPSTQVSTSAKNLYLTVETPERNTNVLISDQETISSDKAVASDEIETIIRTKSYVSMPKSEEQSQAKHRDRVQQRKKMRLTSKSTKRRKRKTKIMVVLTVMFISTTVCFLLLIGKIANDDVLQEISDTSRTVYFFFLRLYFINHLVNPVVYGLLDPNFQKSLKQLICRRKC